MKKRNSAEKKQLGNVGYLLIHIPLLTIVLALIMCLNVVASFLQPMFDTFVMAPSERIINAEKVSYYEQETDDSEEARNNAEKVALRVCEEGEVLLKNNGVLPLKEKSEVTPFGYGYLNPFYSGSGAGSSDGSKGVSPEKALKQYFRVNTATTDVMKEATVEELQEAEGTTLAKPEGSFLSNDSTIYQYPSSVYVGTENRIKGTNAIVFLTRQGNEGADKKMDEYSDGTPHYLALTTEEKETIRFAKKNCEKVIVVLVSSNALELSPLMSGELEADAILWVGNPGSQGFFAMSEIMSGKVNPSGKLVDTYATDFTKDPTFVNMGEFQYGNASTDDAMPGYFIEYQEGIYSGYRYYETADAEDDGFVYGEIDEKGACKEAGAVCYPFGYGLSYTDFSQDITDFSYENDEINVGVLVTNTGKVSGKETVQIYYTSPYTDYDEENKIEKSQVKLVAFDKTKEIKPGESCRINLSFKAEDMASYDYRRMNQDGTKGGYVLEQGDYVVSLRKNSHNVLAERKISVDETVVYADGNKRSDDKVVATNQFEECNGYMDSETVLLSRADWTNTMPEKKEERTKTISDELYQTYLNSKEIDLESDEVFGNQPGSLVYAKEAPVENARNGLVLSELRGCDYDDEKWDRLLDQLNLSDEEVMGALFGAAYQTSKIASIGKNATTEGDGDTGLTIFSNHVTTASWASKPVLAATWNKKLMYEVGKAFGQEALTDGLSGWYAPAMNIHRSPFAGRNFEYFSEDGYLSGKLAASLVSGAGDQGLVCYIKHFAVNDQETHREHYLNTWADEQTMREIYFQPFEICVKEASMKVHYTDEDGKVNTAVMPATAAVMSAQNCIGTTICFGNYSLLTGVLRNEWGFCGVVITDLYMSDSATLSDQMLRAGGDTFLMHNMKLFRKNASDTESATAKTAMRNAIHHLCYAYVNSAEYKDVAPKSYVKYGASKLIYIMIGFDIVVALLFIKRIGKIVKRVRQNSKNVD
ncbi:MAG: glycoside hydrolase family 3 C-terminal domain-containing protein [Lachnospiraceae bacterium]|nr:glycoside hydrolase family 3 C-terminal domain-containing protein [Lachnospiraceae bacterium]